MALTDEEKRLLARLEASLAADDPKLASLLRGHGRHQVPVQRVLLAGVGFTAGVTLLVVGIQTHPLVSVAGFLIMLAATVAALGVWRHPGNHRYLGSRTRFTRELRTGAVRDSQPDHRDNGSAFMAKMEDRWRRRRENS